MLEILKFIESGFWVFVGFIIILYAVCDTIITLFRRFTLILVILIKGYPPKDVRTDDDFIDDDEHEEE